MFECQSGAAKFFSLSLDQVCAHSRSSSWHRAPMPDERWRHSSPARACRRRRFPPSRSTSPSRRPRSRRTFSSRSAAHCAPVPPRRSRAPRARLTPRTRAIRPLGAQFCTRIEFAGITPTCLHTPPSQVPVRHRPRRRPPPHFRLLLQAHERAAAGGGARSPKAEQATRREGGGGREWRRRRRGGGGSGGERRSGERRSEAVDARGGQIADEVEEGEEE